MKSLFKRFLGDEDGLETIEVIIILIISVAAAGVLTAFFIMSLSTRLTRQEKLSKASILAVAAPAVVQAAVLQLDLHVH